MSDTTDLRVLMVDSENSWRGGEAQMLLLMKGLLPVRAEAKKGIYLEV